MAGCINHHPEEVNDHGTSQAEIWEFPGKLLPRVCLMQFMACGAGGIVRDDSTVLLCCSTD